uniref:FYVE-type domain-containing protein n=1 Tax=Globisporangium ultimum (strain ATCC 200006 / CBS 805.95 / DAOM BR144) TaxID=431595 RepID=K3WFU2_GLOUD
MKRANTPQDTVRPIELTADEYRMLVEEAERVVNETLVASDLFIANQRQLPRNEWKHVKTREKIHVYRSRRTNLTGESSGGEFSQSSSDASFGGRTYAPYSTAEMLLTGRNDSSSNGSVSSSSGTGLSDQSLIELMKPADSPLMVATGIVAGEFEDAVFGTISHTERLWRLRDVYLQDPYIGMKVLASITVPTLKDPFNALTLKWSMKELGPIARTRDCVYLEGTGTTTDSNGEQVAYYLMHSINSIKRAPGFGHLDVLRGRVSTCFIARPHNQSSIEMFARGFFDLGGNFLSTIEHAIYAEMLLGSVQVVDLSYVKKLIWLMHEKRFSGGGASTRPFMDAKNCENCSASLSKFGGLLSSKAVCEACQKVVCGKCSVVKKIPMTVSSTEAIRKSLSFCVLCVLEAKNAPVRQVALALMQSPHA